MNKSVTLTGLVIAVTVLGPLEVLNRKLQSKTETAVDTFHTFSLLPFPELLLTVTLIFNLFILLIKIT